MDEGEARMGILKQQDEALKAEQDKVLRNYMAAMAQAQVQVRAMGPGAPTLDPVAGLGRRVFKLQDDHDKISAAMVLLTERMNRLEHAAQADQNHYAARLLNMQATSRYPAPAPSVAWTGAVIGLCLAALAGLSWWGASLLRGL